MPSNDAMLTGALILAGALIGSHLAASSDSASGFKPVFLDRRAQARLSNRAAPYTRKRRANEVVRGVVLHQMGFSRGNDPSKYDAVTAHYKVLPDGTIVWSHDHSTNLPAANRFNSYTVSVEFAGNLPKRIGSRAPSDFWSPQKMGMNNLTEAQVRSGRWLMRMLHDKYGLREVYGHVQSEDDKGNDPGPAIWSRIGEYAKRIGMSDGGPGFHIRGGAPIPSRWTQAGAMA